MTNKGKIFIGLTFLTLAATVLSAQVRRLKLCCIAGDYKGSQVHSQLPDCPLPKSENFTMAISQARGCGTDVWGTITSSSGELNKFKGTLSRGPKGCCVLNASFSSPGHPEHVVTLTGTFCRKLAKWTANGIYTEINSGDPCKQSGTWQLQQI